MEKTYNYDIDSYHFDLYVGDDGYRWDDEGVLQPIKMTINGHCVIDNNWGIEHNLEYSLGESRSDSGMQNAYDSNSTIYFTDKGIFLRIETSSVDADYIAIRGEQHQEFKSWVKSCLSPKPERIKMKIDKILDHKKKD